MAETRQFNFANFATSVLESGLGVSDTEMFVSLGTEHLFPNADATYAEIFACILSNEDVTEDVEVVYVTATGLNQFSVERGKEGTTARSWPAGTSVVHSITAQLFTDIVVAGPRLTGGFFALTTGGTTGLEMAAAFSPNFKWFNIVTPNVGTWDGVIQYPEDHATYPNRMVVVTTNVVYYSDDGGFTWTAGTISTGSWIGLAFSPTLDRLVAVGSAGTNRAAYSDDGGVTWTNVTITAVAWQDVIWVPWANSGVGAFIAGTTNSHGSGNIAYSVDGTAWVNLATDLRSVYALAHDGSNQILTANRGDIQNLYCQGDPLTAANWGSVNPVSSGSLDVESNGAGQFVMSDAGPPNELWFGTDASVAMTAAATQPVTEQWEDFAWSEKLLLYCGIAASGGTNTRAITSPDGDTWTYRQTPQGLVGFDEVIAWQALEEPFKYFVGTQHVGVLMSPDLVKWVAVIDPTLSNMVIQHMIWDPVRDRLIAFNNVAQCIYSDDRGFTWTAATITGAASGNVNKGVLRIPDGTNAGRIIYGNVNAVANGAWYSDDGGVTWTQASIGASPTNNFAIEAIARNPSTGRIVAAGDSTLSTVHFAYSDDDGATWTTVADGIATADFLNIEWDSDNSRFIAVTAIFGNDVYTSSDGVTWTGRADISLFTVPEVVFRHPVSGRLIAAAPFNTFWPAGYAYSDDGGVNWSETTTQFPSNNQIEHMVWDADNLQIVGVGRDLVANFIWVSSDGDTWTEKTASGHLGNYTWDLTCIAIIPDANL